MPTIDDQFRRAVKLRAAHTGKGESQVIDDALRRELGLELLDQLWARADLPEEEALEVAVEAQPETRRRRR